VLKRVLVLGVLMIVESLLGLELFVTNVAAVGEGAWEMNRLYVVPEVPSV